MYTTKIYTSVSLLHVSAHHTTIIREFTSTSIKIPLTAPERPQQACSCVHFVCCVDKHLSLFLWSEQISCRWSVRSVKCVVSSGVLIIGICTVRATQRFFQLILSHAHTSMHCLLLPLSLHGSAHTLSCLFRYCSFANTEFADTVWSTFLSHFLHQGRPDRYWRFGQVNNMAPHSIRYSINFFGLGGAGVHFWMRVLKVWTVLGDLSLPAPYFWLFQWCLSAAYRPALRAAARLARLLGVSGIIGNVVLVNSGLHMRLLT